MTSLKLCYLEGNGAFIKLGEASSDGFWLVIPLDKLTGHRVVDFDIWSPENVELCVRREYTRINTSTDLPFIKSFYEILENYKVMQWSGNKYPVQGCEKKYLTDVEFRYAYKAVEQWIIEYEQKDRPVSN